jgi:hypothetical protein
VLVVLVEKEEKLQEAQLLEEVPLQEAQLLEEVLLQVEATAKPIKMIQNAMMLTVMLGQVKEIVKMNGLII